MSDSPTAPAPENTLSPGKMHFRRMDDMTRADFAVLKRVHEENLARLPDLLLRLLHRDHPHFARTAEFCARYDEVSFVPDYPSEPLATFEPMLRRVLNKSWTPPGSGAATGG